MRDAGWRGEPEAAREVGAGLCKYLPRCAGCGSPTDFQAPSPPQLRGESQVV